MENLSKKLLVNEKISKITDEKEKFFEGMDVVGLGIITDERLVQFLNIPSVILFE